MAKQDSPRIALVGASSILGKEIKDLLASSSYPSSSVALLDLEELAGVLTEYGDEARVLAETAEAEILHQDLVCFCGDRRIVREHMPRILEAGHVALDCTGAWLHEPDAVLALPAAGRLPSMRPGQAIVLPSAATQLLATVSAALGDAAAGLGGTILLPASEPGDEGLDELARQCIAVLNLEDVPHAVFGRQQAFDIWPEPGTGDGEKASALDIEHLRDLGLPIPAVAILCAPVFHCLSATLHVPGQETDLIMERLARAGIARSEVDDDMEERIDSPVRMAGTSGVRVGLAWADGQDGTWLWVLMDNVVARAEAALSTIQALLPPPAIAD
jgi:aspartate-semialdehyde dehydrogenase